MVIAIKHYELCLPCYRDMITHCKCDYNEESGIIESTRSEAMNVAEILR